MISKKIIFFGSFILSVWLALTHQTIILGQATLLLLTLILFSKPLARLFPTIAFFKFLLVVRRELGIASGFAAFGHVYAQSFPGFTIIDALRFDFESGPASFQFWGLWGLVFIIPLFVTANDFSTRLLKRNWFLLHKLVHPLYIVAILHWSLQRGSERLYFGVAVLLILYTLRFLAARGVTFFAPNPPVGGPPSPPTSPV